jgi:hypothetical protein
MTTIPVPWVPGISDAERLARYRGLRALVWEALATMPGLQRRRVLASLATPLKASPTKERKAG